MKDCNLGSVTAWAKPLLPIRAEEQNHHGRNSAEAPGCWLGPVTSYLKLWRAASDLVDVGQRSAVIGSSAVRQS